MASSSELTSDRADVIERTAPGEVRVRRALLSVSDKSGVIDFARGLRELGVELVSTGGTARELTGPGSRPARSRTSPAFPEIMDGRVKTLHPKVHGGLLCRARQDPDTWQAAANGIELIDMVVVNLYPFEQTVARPGVALEEVIENIDIGGPSMLRAPPRTTTASRWSAIRRITTRCCGSCVTAAGGCPPPPARSWPARRSPPPPATTPPSRAGSPQLRRGASRRAGARPTRRSSTSATARTPTSRPPSTPGSAPGHHLLEGVNQLHGKELSFNNLLDLSSARELVEDFHEPACAIVKHNNPCGCAVADTA